MLRMFLFFFLLCLLVGPAQADLSLSAQQNLPAKLHQLTASYESRVGVAFIDPKSGWIFSINGSSEFPAASVAKVPVMAAAYHLADSGLLNLERKVPFHNRDKLGGSGVLQWLRGGRTYTIRNLIRLMIVLSDNTATKLVVDTLGLKRINQYLTNIGLTETIINDPTMLVEPPALFNNRTTPNDMAKLIEKIYRSKGFSSAAAKEMLSFMRSQKYRWGLWRGVPPGTTIANKTGNLEGILNDVGIIYTKKGNYILAVFTQQFKKQREARLIINNISRITYEEYTGEKVIQPQAKKTKRTYRSYPKKKIKKKIISKRRLWRRPSVKSPRRSGHRGAASSRKSQTSPQR